MRARIVIGRHDNEVSGVYRRSRDSSASCLQL